MNIRLALESDIPRINDLLYQVHKVHSDPRPDIFVPGEKKYTDDELKSIIKDDTTPIFVAEDEQGVVLGYCFCVYQITKGERNMTDRKVLYIDDLCVDESARGTHVGSALCRYAEKFARENSFDSVTLNVWQFNESARAFYDNMGFVPLKTTLEKIL